MRTLANIIWHFPFFGFLSAFGIFLIGGLFVITVVGAPIGLGLIQLSKFMLSPFSSSMISKSELNTKQNTAWKTYGIIATIFYIPFGLLMCIITVLQIAGLFVSIIGIPIALVLAKSLSTIFNPVNKVCVPVAVAQELEIQKTRDDINRYLHQ